MRESVDSKNSGEDQWTVAAVHWIAGRYSISELIIGLSDENDKAWYQCMKELAIASEKDSYVYQVKCFPEIC